MKFNFKSAPKPARIADKDWQSWIWQMQNSLHSEAEFAGRFNLSPAERAAFVTTATDQPLFNFRCTPYYASLATDEPQDPIRRIFLPHQQELNLGSQSMLDPLGERKNNPTPRVIHRYSDRLLFLVTDVCSVYCRYCTRKHFTGQEAALIGGSDYQKALQYIKSHSGIREVILSGGDPLTLGDGPLLRILHDLRKIEHVEIIRIGTRMPVVNPTRISVELAQNIKKFKPVYFMTHFNHPRELTTEAAQAVENLIDHGVPVFNQMVLLNGINNHAAVVQALSRRLLFLRVKPYYMFQCDPSQGTDHLRTTIENSESIQKELWGHLSGLAMPTLSLDIPDGGGKTTLVPNFERSRTQTSRFYKGWDGVESEYKNPPENSVIFPPDIGEYLEEWNALKAGKIKTDSNPLEASELGHEFLDRRV